MRKFTRSVAAATILALALAACGGDDGSEDTAAEPVEEPTDEADEADEADAADDADDAAADDAAADDAAADDGEVYDITFIQGVIGDEFYISMECGVLQAAEELGVNVSVQGPQRWDPALQQPIVSSVVSASPDAILIAPNDVTALQRPLEEAANAGIEVVLVDTTVEDPSFAVSEIASDNVGGGAAAFSAIQELVPDGGKVLVIDNQPGISTSDARVQGFEEAVAEDDSFDYLGVEYAQNQPARAAQIVTSTLQRDPDLQAIFATNIFSAEGAATGIEQADARGDVVVIGFDAGPAQIDALEDDILQAIIAQQPYQIGYDGVYQAVAKLRGEATESQIQTGFSIITKETWESGESTDAAYASSCN